MERLEVEEPQYTIEYNPSDIESIKVALSQYIELVVSGNAFSNSHCVAHFKTIGEELTLSFFEDNPVIHDFLLRRIFRSNNKVLEGQLLTETIFFACALMFPDMKEGLELACQRIVNFARELNDSAEMWITEEQPFAIEALTLFAYQYPEMGYLLAGFLVPYWDDEHMPEPLCVLADWAMKQGLSRDVIKAYAYCDNAMARAFVLGYDIYDDIDNADERGLNFLSHFRNNADDYQYFKEVLAKRFHKQPYVQYSKDRDSFIQNPIEVLFVELMRPVYPCDIYDEEFDKDEYQTQLFVNDTAEVEVEQVKSLVEAHLGTFITVWKPELPRSKQHVEKGQDESAPFARWKTFIEEELGYKLWKYIEYGRFEHHLSTVKELAIFKISKNNNHALFQELAEEVLSDEELKESLHDVLRPLFGRFKRWSTDSEESQKQIMLRFLDVLFRLCGSQPFVVEVEELVDDLELCSSEVYKKRYSAHWLDQLTGELKLMGRYFDYASRQKLQRCYEILEANRDDLSDHIDALFAIKQLHSEDNELRTENRYGAAEVLALAAYVLSKDQEYEQYDDLTEAASEYLNQHLIEKVLLDLYGETDFPAKYIVDHLQGRSKLNFSDSEIAEYEGKYNEWLRFETYIREGTIEKDSEVLPSKPAKAEAFEIIEFFLEYEDEDISKDQKQIKWLLNFSEETQKLLYAAVEVALNGNLKVSDAARRLIELTFELAPVKVCYLLSKAYKADLYRIDSQESMFAMLERFKEVGLSDKGYWAYLLDEYSDERRDEKRAYYQLLLHEWSTHDQDKPKGTFLSYQHISQRKSLKEGFHLLSYEQQIKVIDDAASVIKEKNFTTIYNDYLLKLLDRELKEKGAVCAPEMYFYKRLKGEGHPVHFIDWKEWSSHPSIIEEVLNNIMIEKPERLNDENHADQIFQRKEWSYIVLQKQNGHLVPLLGYETLWLLQKGFDVETICQAHVKAVIVDENCPQDHIDELINFSHNGFRWRVRKMFKSYLKNDCTFDEMERFARYGIESYFFLDRRVYFDYSYSDILMKVHPTIMKNAFCLLGAIDSKYLTNHYDHTNEAHFNLLLSYGVDHKAIYNMYLQNNDIRYIVRLARQVDIQGFVLESKIAQQLSVLSGLATLPKYHPFILSLRNSKSVKLDKHVEMLATKYQMENTSEPAYRIVDFGVYQMGGAAGTSDDGIRKVVNEPLCIKQIQHMKGEVGMYFGFRFTTTTPELSPKVLEHDVIVGHPVRHSVTGELVQTESRWHQNGYSESNIFLGWYFENEESILPGTYQMLVCDKDRVVLAEKSFVVY